MGHSYWTLQAESLCPFAFSKSIRKHLPASLSILSGVGQVRSVLAPGVWWVVFFFFEL